MATDIVQSLFGMTPDSYQQAQQARADAQAMQFAKLDPFQQANYSIGRGAYGLAGAVGGALGGQDPELQRITMRQQIAGQIDYNDDASMQQAITALSQAGDTQGAMQLQQIRVGQQVKRASIGKDEAQAYQAYAAAKKEKAPPTTNEITNARALALAEGIEGSPEYNIAYKKELTRLNASKVVNDPRFGVDRESISEELYDKPFALLTQADRAIVNKRVEDEQGRKAREGAPKIINQLPGLKGAPDIVGLRSTINTTLKPYRDGLNAANSAIELADDVLKTGNFASFGSLSRALAKASGETQLSKADVAAFGGDPSFVGSIADMASKLGTGTPTADTTRKLKALAVLLKKKNESLEKDEIKQLQTTARISGLYTEDQIKNVFTLRGESKGTTRKTAGGISYTVED